MFRLMEKPVDTFELQQERSGLLNEASRIGAIAAAERRKLTQEEDNRVLDIMKRVQILEKQIARPKK